MKVSRVFFSIIIILAVALLFLLPDAFAKQIVLKAGHISPPLSMKHKGAVKFAELVKERTNGQVKVDVYPAQQLGKANAQLQALSMATQDICFESLAWWSQFDKDFGYYNVPFVFNTYDEIFKAYQSDVGQAMFDRVLKKAGIRCLAYNFEDNLRNLYTVKKPIHHPDDLKGVNMRVPGIKIYIEAWKLMGANTIRVSWGELYTALLQGIVEATEGPLVASYKTKALDIEKYITMLNYKPSPLTVSISEITWKKLPKDIQEILKKAATDAGNYFTEQMRDEIEKVKTALKKQGNIFVEFDRQAFIDKAASLPIKFEEEGLWSKGLHEKMMKALGKK